MRRMADEVKWTCFTVRYTHESMPPKKRERQASDARIYESQALLLLEFQEHDLKFRTSNGDYKYFICSRCTLRVSIKNIQSGVRCSNSVLNQPCASAIPVPAPVVTVQLCAVCLTAECMYACSPCMHKCVCKTCASSLRQCPICRSAVVNWKQIFEAGIEGNAEDIVVQEETGGPVVLPPVQQVRVDIDPSSSDDADVDSSSSVEYVPQHRELTDSLSPPPSPRPHRQQQVTDSEWILRTTYCRRWSEAALIARGGNRGDAVSLLQSFHWTLRTCAFDRILSEVVDMGFNELPARVCLLSNNGDKVLAVEELLRSGVYVVVNGIVYEKHT